MECRDDQYCESGSCVCRPGLTASGTACVDTDTDPANCGAVGAACSTGAPACSGGTCVAACPTGLTTCGNRCVDTETDPLRCGGCGDACDRDEVCVRGECRGFDVGVTCTTCPCTSCGGGDSCCTYPGTTDVVCVNDDVCPT
jgi:hypothetical protein